APQGRLRLGDGPRHAAELAGVIPAYRHQRARQDALLQDHAAAGEPARSGEDRLRGFVACGAWAGAVAEHWGVLLTAGAT
ncbi:hypothetical protein R0J90_22400, partial [Micrococcus sp. SIMBA_144]